MHLNTCTGNFTSDHNRNFPAALAFAHLARAAAAILARPAGLIVRLPGPLVDATFAVLPPLAARTFAHRARAAAPMRARPAALICRGPPRMKDGAGADDDPPSRIFPSSSVSDSMRSFRSAALRSWAGDRFVNSIDPSRYRSVPKKEGRNDSTIWLFRAAVNHGAITKHVRRNTKLKRMWRAEKALVAPVVYEKPYSRNQ